MAMRQFIKLTPAFWIGNTGRALRDAGQAAQLVALYLISNPHVNYIGIYRLPLAYAKTDLGMTEKVLLKALATLDELGFAKFDPATEMVWVIQGAFYQIGETLAEKDRRVKFVHKEYAAVPRVCPLKAEFFAKYAEAYGLSDAPISTTRPVQQKAAWVPDDEPEWLSRRAESQTQLRDIEI